MFCGVNKKNCSKLDFSFQKSITHFW